jgi:hypothetical protein
MATPALAPAVLDSPETPRQAQTLASTATQPIWLSAVMRSISSTCGIDRGRPQKFSMKSNEKLSVANPKMGATERFRETVPRIKS